MKKNHQINIEILRLLRKEFNLTLPMDNCDSVITDLYPTTLQRSKEAWVWELNYNGINIGSHIAKSKLLKFPGLVMKGNTIHGVNDKS